MRLQDCFMKGPVCLLLAPQQLKKEIEQKYAEPVLPNVKYLITYRKP